MEVGESPTVAAPTAEAPGARRIISQSYICSICNYYCDTQRTLKAHMWKHSGHKNLQYPIFQNGPLSVYDDTPLAAKNFMNKISGTKESDNVDCQSECADVTKSVAVAKRSKLVQCDMAEPAPKVIVQKLRQSSDINTAIYDRTLGSVEWQLTFDEEAQAMATAATTNDSCDLSMAADHSLHTQVVAPSADPLTVMTAVCEAVKRNEVTSQQADAIPRVNSNCYSATEKTAATLLSLLRQGMVMHAYYTCCLYITYR